MKTIKPVGILFAALLLAGAAFAQDSSRINNGGKSGASGLTLPSGTDTGAANAYVVTTSPAQSKTALVPSLQTSCVKDPVTSFPAGCALGQFAKAVNDVIIVGVTAGGDSTPPTFSVTDTILGLTYLPLTPVFGTSTPGIYGQFFYAIVPSVYGSNGNILVSPSAGTSSISLAASEWTNLSLSSLADGSNSTTAASSSGTITVPSFTATNGDLLFGYEVATSSVAVGSGFTEIVHNSSKQMYEQQTLSGTTASVTFSSSSGAYLAMGVALKPRQAGAYGASFTFVATHANTGTSTMDATGSGPVPLRAFNTNGTIVDLASGILDTTHVYQVTSDGIEWLLSGPLNVAGQGPPNLNAGSLNLAGGYMIPQSVGGQGYNPALTILGVPSPGNVGQNRFMFNIACPPVTPANGCGAGKLLNFGWDYDGVAIIGNAGTLIGFESSIEQFGNYAVFGEHSAELYAFNSGGGPGPTFASVTAPTILAAGCGGSAASIVTNNGTLVFKVNVGTSNTGTCTVTMPAATTDWICSGTDITTTSTTVSQTKVIPTSGHLTTEITLQNYTDISGTGAWTDSDVIGVSCHAE